MNAKSIAEIVDKNDSAKNKQTNTQTHAHTVSVNDWDLRQLERFEIYEHKERIECFRCKKNFLWNSKCHDVVPLDFAIASARKTNFDWVRFVYRFSFEFSTSNLRLTNQPTTWTCSCVCMLWACVLLIFRTLHSQNYLIHPNMCTQTHPRSMHIQQKFIIQ